jgi:hypothetical protein
MEGCPYIHETTCILLNRLLPDLAIEPKQHILESSGQAVGLYLDLPTPVGADYHFRLWVSPEIQISARLIDPGTSNYFWFMPFPKKAFWKTPDELQRILDNTLEALISHETRIVQTRGLIFHTFNCDCKSATGWKQIYGHATLRSTEFRLPPTAERKRIYRSPAVKLL